MVANTQEIAIFQQHAPARKTRGPSILPLTVSRICFKAGGHSLINQVSFTLETGSCTIVLGPNGAGKSLLLRLCHGLITPVSGTIDWNGTGPSQAQPWLAMVFQRPVLLRRSAAANVDYALKIRGVERRERKIRTAQALAHTDLSHLAARSARVLSGGEQQRLAMARAWALQPQVLFLDEPTSSLDPTATRAVEELVKTIHRSGTTILMTTHDLGQARRLAREILFLHRGRLLEHTPADEFFTQPRSSEAAAFIQGKLLY